MMLIYSNMSLETIKKTILSIFSEMKSQLATLTIADYLSRLDYVEITK